MRQPELSCDPPAPPDGDPCPCGDGSPGAAVPVVRNRYFTGKYMTARDFRDEQEYFLARQRLHLRALHGWGIVCGLDVKEHDADCRARGWVVVTPGIAVDCLGREIILQEKVAVELPALLRYDDGRPDPADPVYDKKKYGTKGWDPDRGPADDTEFLLGIRYGEVCVEPVPVLVDEGGCRSRTTPNRVEERPAFRFRESPENDPCWRPCGRGGASHPPAPGPDFPCGCGDPAADPAAPQCRCDGHGFVPLARFKIRRGENGTVTRYKVGGADPDVSGRRYLFGPLHPLALTHIGRVNWRHGGTTGLDDLRKVPAWAGADLHDPVDRDTPPADGWARLTIGFDRPLCHTLPSEEAGPVVGRGGAVALYPNVFRVTFEHPTHGPQPLVTNPEYYRYRLSPDRRRLHYEFRVEHRHQEVKDCHHGVVVRVVLNCDFLPDEYGRAVDGNHLRGSVGWVPPGPTGDGVEGGVFESWFHLTVPDAAQESKS